MGHTLFVIEHSTESHLPACVGDRHGLQLTVKTRIAWGNFVPEQLRCCQEQVVVADAVLQAPEAIRMFQWLREHPIRVPTFAIVSVENPELVRLAAATVDDFLIWPVQPEEFRTRLLRLADASGGGSYEKLRDQMVGEVGLRQAVGRAPRFLAALKRVALFGPNSAPVLLTGETGTGKELFARLLHLLSPRRSGPFVPVECGAIPEQLFENELFGHAKGAFTDARTEHKGCVGLANGGTLFLDEIDCLSPSGQGKLLRLIQEKKFRPLGAEQFRDADVRIIAATNRDIAKMVEMKLFRQDLFFRLDVLRVHLPPLRERTGDTVLLAKHFVDTLCDEGGLKKKILSPASLRKLEYHQWPGNIRELYNTIQRAVLTTEGNEIVSSQIDIQQESRNRDEESPSFQLAKNAAIQRFEREFVQRVLERHGGNVTRAAREVGKDRRAFGRLAKKYGLQNPLE